MTLEKIHGGHYAAKTGDGWHLCDVRRDRLGSWGASSRKRPRVIRAETPLGAAAWYMANYA